MNQHKRQISSGALINLAGIAFGVFLNIWLLPKIGSTEELGLYRWFERTAILLSNVLMLGLHRSYTKFHSDPNRDGKEFQSALLVRSTWIILATALVLYWATPFSAHWLQLDQYQSLLGWLGPMTAGGMAFLMAVSVAATTGKIALPLLYKNLGLRLGMIGLGLAMLWGNLSFQGWIIGYGWVYFLLGVGSLLYAWRRAQPQWRWDGLRLGIGPQVVHFAGYSVLGSFIEFGLSTLDVQMLALLTDLESVGVYGMAFFIGSVIDGIRRPINQMLAPQISKHWNEGKIGALQKIYRKTSDVQIIFNAAFIILVMVNVDWVFSLIPDGERFYPAIPVVGWVLLGKFINSAFGSNGEIIINSPFYQFNLYFSSATLVLTIALNLYFIPAYGIVGVAYTSALALVVVNVARAILLYRKANMVPFSVETVYILGISGALWLLCDFLPVDGMLRLMISTAIVGATVFASRKFIQRLIIA
jgi:O-antigen/teichoic acid export membrane protein